MEDMQPGQIIVPHDPSPPASQAPTVVTPAPQSQPSPVPQAITVSQPVVAPQPSLAPLDATQVPLTGATPMNQPQPAIESAPQAGFVSGAPADTAADWQYTSPVSDADTPLPETMTWSAAEFIAHEKSPAWYAMLAVVGVALACLIYFITKDKISTGVILLALTAFGIFAARKPRTQQYALGAQGLQIGQKEYNFQDFKTFSINEEAEIVSILFMPLKRFMPPLTVYVAPAMEDQVVDYLSAFLPYEQHQPDAVDSLLRRIHF